MTDADLLMKLYQRVKKVRSAQSGVNTIQWIASSLKYKKQYLVGSCLEFLFADGSKIRMNNQRVWIPKENCNDVR